VVELCFRNQLIDFTYFSNSVYFPVTVESSQRFELLIRKPTFG
jgi:hypothetical protein